MLSPKNICLLKCWYEGEEFLKRDESCWPVNKADLNNNIIASSLTVFEKDQPDETSCDD